MAEIVIKKEDLPYITASIQYPFTVCMSIQWPQTYMANGIKYYRMDKEGTNIKTGLPSCCYTAANREVTPERIWVMSDGSWIRD